MRTALLYDMEIESPYYLGKKTIIFQLICSNYIVNNNFVNENIIRRETSNRELNLYILNVTRKARNWLSIKKRKLLSLIK